MFDLDNPINMLLFMAAFVELERLKSKETRG